MMNLIRESHRERMYKKMIKRWKMKKYSDRRHSTKGPRRPQDHTEEGGAQTVPLRIISANSTGLKVTQQRPLIRKGKMANQICEC